MNKLLDDIAIGFRGVAQFRGTCDNCGYPFFIPARNHTCVEKLPDRLVMRLDIPCMCIRCFRQMAVMNIPLMLQKG